MYNESVVDHRLKQCPIIAGQAVHQASLPDDAQPGDPGGEAGGPSTSDGRTIQPGFRTPDELTHLPQNYQCV